ncbi:MAG: phasin, PhaP [Pseudomonadota bacterium]
MAAKNSNDYTKMMKDMMGAFPVDMSAMQDAFKTQAALSDKLSKVALEAADKSTEISAKWTKETLTKLGSVTTLKDDPADYTKAMTDFASTQAEMSAETMAAFAEVAKRVQMETVELLLAAGKDMSEDATAAVKKATAEVTAAAKKATAAVK